MDFLKKFDTGPLQVLKFALLALVAVIVLTLAMNFFRGSANPFTSSGIYSGNSVSMREEASLAQDSYQSYGEDGDMAYSGKMGAPSIGVRNVMYDPTMPPMPGGNGTPGADAEAFEVKDYGVTIESMNVSRDCAAIVALKSREDVIFNSGNEYDRGCNYSFKVVNGSVENVLGILKNMNPKDLSENAYTIKNIVSDYTSQEQILKEKLATVDETLAKALAAYDDVTVLATRTQDAASLAQIIDSKINIIERLTMMRAEINAQLTSLSRAKAEELDRLDYTYFNVNVYENKFVDGENLKDSWKQSVQQSLYDINRVAQQLSVGLVALIFFIFQYVIYGLILLFVAKFGWKFVKEIWQK